MSLKNKEAAQRAAITNIANRMDPRRAMLLAIMSLEAWANDAAGEYGHTDPVRIEVSAAVLVLRRQLGDAR